MAISMIPRDTSDKSFELSIPDVAGALGISTAQVYDKLNAGVIPGHRVGRKKGRWCVLRSEFERWQAEGPRQEEPTTATVDLGSLVGAELTLEVKIRVVKITPRGERA